MNRKSLSIMGLAVGCGLVAMYGAGQLLTKKERPIEYRDVLLAARDLRVEEVLKPDMLQVEKRPAGMVPPGAFTSPSEVEGRWIQIPTLKDEVILSAKLAPKDLPPGLTSRIPKGKRAFAIEVNEQTGVSGFVLPDHRVDVLQDLRDHSGNARSASGRTILQNMLVLAVGQVFTRPEDKSLLARTVTLATTMIAGPPFLGRSVAEMATGFRAGGVAGAVYVAPRPEPVMVNVPASADGCGSPFTVHTGWASRRSRS